MIRGTCIMQHVNSSMQSCAPSFRLALLPFQDTRQPITHSLDLVPDQHKFACEYRSESQVRALSIVLPKFSPRVSKVSPIDRRVDPFPPGQDSSRSDSIPPILLIAPSRNQHSMCPAFSARVSASSPNFRRASEYCADSQKATNAIEARRRTMMA